MRMHSCRIGAAANQKQRAPHSFHKPTRDPSKNTSRCLLRFMRPWYKYQRCGRIHESGTARKRRHGFDRRPTGCRVSTYPLESVQNTIPRGYSVDDAVSWRRVGEDPNSRSRVHYPENIFFYSNFKRLC